MVAKFPFCFLLCRLNDRVKGFWRALDWMNPTFELIPLFIKMNHFCCDVEVAKF